MLSSLASSMSAASSIRRVTRSQWFDTPHMPHAWECGVVFERTTRILLCSDLFTEGVVDHPPSPRPTSSSRASAFGRKWTTTYSHAKNGPQILMRLAETRPAMLARMHGSAWRGDGAAMLAALAEALDHEPSPV